MGPRVAAVLEYVPSELPGIVKYRQAVADPGFLRGWEGVGGGGKGGGVADLTERY